MNRHSSRALSIRLLTTSLSLVICLATSSSVFAQLVLYDGALGDADPVTQGWNLTLNASPAIATVTPDSVNDYVVVVVQQDIGGPPGPRDWQYNLPSNLPSLVNEVADDSYQWKLKFELNEFFFMGFPTGTSRHTLNDFRLNTGRSSGSVGYQDRVFIEDDRIRFVDLPGAAQFRLDFAFRKDNLVPTFPLGSPPEFDIAPNWDTMLAMNELTFNRVGNRVEVFMNDDFIMSGFTNSSSIASTQLTFSDNADTERTDMNWARFEVGDAQPLLVATPPSSHALFDGSYFGGNPIKQGWQVEPLSPGLTLTPDAINDLVTVENSTSNFRFKIPAGVRKVVDESKDDYYKWTIEFSVDTVDHEAVQLKYVGGDNRESIVIEDDQIRVIGVGTIPLQAAGGFDMILTPGETANFTSMADVNELSMFRKGEEVYITINGDIVFRGVGGAQVLADGQFEFTNDTDGGVLATDFDLYAFSTSSPLEGDYDADGDVDNDDFALWDANFGTVLDFNPTAALYQIDGNQNHVIDAADYTIWRDNLGATAAFLGLTVPLLGDTSASSVPEPTTGLLACFAIAAGGMRLRWRNLDHRTVGAGQSAETNQFNQERD